MPKETDKTRLAQLVALLSERASGYVTFRPTAETGGHRPDTGLEALLPSELTQGDRREQLKAALVEWLRAGNQPNRREDRGDAAMQLDPVTIYEFRLTVEEARILVQIEFVDDDPRDPTLRVRSVKRDDTAWK